MDETTRHAVPFPHPARHVIPCLGVVFDIDGTLTATNAVDDECYCEAIAAELGVSVSMIDWSGAPHITDGGIAQWLFRQHAGRLPSPSEVTRVRRRFVSLLERRLVSTPLQFVAIPGACDTIARLFTAGHIIAFATGGWAESARMKLAAARIPTVSIPLASADDALTREEIVSLAIKRCPGESQPPSRMVAVGDAVWDVNTARRLLLPFVGIAQGDKAERLRAAGATHVLPDLRYEPLLSALVASDVPNEP